MKLAEKITVASKALAKVEETAFDQLDFDFEGILVKAVSKPSGSGGEVLVSANLGRLYYTAEKADQRTMALERISSTNRGIDGAYRIDRESSVHFESRTATDTFVKGDRLLSALTLIILEAEPHLRGISAHLKPL